MKTRLVLLSAFAVAVSFIPHPVSHAATRSAKLVAPQPQLCAVVEETCTTGCPGGTPCYTLIIDYVTNVAVPGQPPDYISGQTFTDTNYPSIEDAWCGARKLRREGVVVLLDAAYPGSLTEGEKDRPGPPFANVEPLHIRPAPVI